LRRFDSPNKQTEGLQGWQTVVEQNTAEGLSPNGVLRNPKMPNRHFYANRVLCEVPHFDFLLSIYSGAM